MQAVATYKYARLSAQKARLVANQIRGLSVDKASNILTFHTQKAANEIKKVLDSAIANAEHNLGLDIDQLKVSEVYINQGPSLKRFRARARGRGDRIVKPTCHITVKVADSEEK